MGVDVNYAKEEHERMKQNQYAKTEYLELAEGPNELRILPPFGASPTAWRKFKKCFGVGPNGKACTPRMDATCPLKIELDRLHALGDKISLERADAMTVKNRIAFMVVTRPPHAQAGKGPLVFDTNVNVYRDILAIIASPDYGDITDIHKGVDITITYTPKTKTADHYPDWSVLAKRHSTPLGTPEEIAAWTSEDQFKKYGVGETSEDAYIKACLEGTEEAYLEGLRKPAAGAPAGQAPAQTQAPPMPGSVQVEVLETVTYPMNMEALWIFDPRNSQQVQMKVKEAAELFKQGLAIQCCTLDGTSGWKKPEDFGFKIERKAAPPVAPPAPVAPPPPAPPAPPPPVAAPAPPPAPTPPAPPTPPPAPVPDRNFWVYNNNTSVKMTETQLKQLVASGFSGPTMLDGETAWKTPADYFKPAGPPMPQSPGPPFSPPAQSGMKPEDIELQRQIEALRQASANGGNSQVAQDLQAQLR